MVRSTQSASNSTSIIQSHNEYVIQIPKSDIIKIWGKYDIQKKIIKGGIEFSGWK